MHLFFYLLLQPEITDMKRKTFTRLLILMLVATSCLIFISYKQAKSSANQECTNGEKCDQKKAQTDLILLESISKHLLSAIDN
jgi:hypothetical protein